MSPEPDKRSPRELDHLAKLALADSPAEFKQALSACEGCLIEIAKEELKIGEEDARSYAQSAILEVRKLLPQFAGSSDAELREWLKAILLDETYHQPPHGPIAESTPNQRQAGTPEPASLESADGAAEFADKHALWQALERLPRDQFQMIHRRHRLQSSLDEIAQILGISVTAARGLYVHALARFAQELSDGTPWGGVCRAIPPLWEEACRHVLAAGPEALRQSPADLEPELLPYFQNVLRCLKSMAIVWRDPSPDQDVTQAAGTPIESRRLPEVPGFVIDRKIGGGGQGVVYRAWHERLKCWVALKFLHPAYARDPERLRRFRQEAEIVARLTEHGVLPIRDMLEADGTLVVVLPYIEGCNLAHVIDQRRKLLQGKTIDGEPHPWSALPDRQFIDRLLPFFDKVVDAMARLNQAGVLHRDLKPSNILVDKNENCWLIDFGLARPADDASTTTDAHLAIGTPGFMSPEQWAGAADVDVRTDIFGLGAAIYQSLCLDFPYGKVYITSETPPAAVPRKKIHFLPPNLDRVLQKALQPDRLKRYPSTAELHEDWQRVRHGLLPTQVQVPRGRQLVHSFRRHQIKVAVGVAVLLTAVSAVLVPATSEKLEGWKKRKELAKIRADLKAGNSVTLIGATGGPRYFHWQTPDSPQQRAFVETKGIFTVEAREQALLELVPDPMCDPYRFEAEMRQDSGDGARGTIGIYFAHARFRANGDPGHICCKLCFNDVGDERANGPENGPPRNALRLTRMAIFESIMTGPDRPMGRNVYFVPGAPKTDMRWRKLGIELTGEALTVSWEGEQVLHLSRDEVLACQILPDERFDVGSLPFEPHGGVGLYLYRSTASFRNVRLEPIPEK